MVPLTVSFWLGDVVPMPTLPSTATVIRERFDVRNSNGLKPADPRYDVEIHPTVPSCENPIMRSLELASTMDDHGAAYCALMCKREEENGDVVPMPTLPYEF